MQHITVTRQAFINRHFFNLTLFALIFGVIFYDMIDKLGFSYTDELCALFALFLFGYKLVASAAWQFNRAFLITLSVFIFYLVYSFVIRSNTPGAILTDFVIQLKPYLSFFCVYAIRPVFSDSQKKIIRQLIALCSVYVLLVGVAGIVNDDIMEFTFGHQSRLATASSVLAILYLYCSDYTKTDRYLFAVILALGLLSTRSKHYGYFVVCILLVFYMNRPSKMKFSFRNVFFFVAALGLTALVAWNKIYFYFVTGGFGAGRSADDLYARMALYYFSTLVLRDFFPFGSGFASYATYASGESYSSIYGKYNMSSMYGLTKSSHDFIADTYYPALAQFGYAGVILFFFFWIRLLKKAVRMFSKGFIRESVMAIMIVVFFLIECTSDATLTHNRGMFMMMMAGLVFADLKNKDTHESTVSQ